MRVYKTSLGMFDGEGERRKEEEDEKVEVFKALLFQHPSKAVAGTTKRS